MAKKKIIATASLAGCFGCHMSFLDIDERILQLVELVDFNKSPINDIKTFTAQGRLTGGILLALPIGITIFTVLMTPDYFRPMLASDGGRVALMIAGGMQLLGALVIRKIVNIKV